MNPPTAARYEMKTTKSGQYAFNLKSGNSQVIGTSQSYKGESSCDGGIQSVMKNAPDAKVEDQTA